MTVFVCICFFGTLKVGKGSAVDVCVAQENLKKSTAFSERRGLAGTLRAEIQGTRDKMRDNIAGNIYLASI